MEKTKGPNRKLTIIGGATAAVLILCCACLAFAARAGSTPTARESATARAIARLTAATTEPTTQDSETALPATQAQSATPELTATPLPPTDTPEPSNTPAPTRTPAPTNTPAPTDTPAPTATATPTATPVVFSGSGDQIIDAENPFNVAVVHITGNANARYFGVTNYGAGNEVLNLLVNTTGRYDGYRPLDFLDGERTLRFEVEASGAWTIEIMPLAQAHTLEVPGSFTGTGDDVLLLTGGQPDTATVTGNAGARYFGLSSYGSDGQVDLLVNTTDVYAGTVLMSPNALLLEVQAEGEWTIEVK